MPRLLHYIQHYQHTLKRDVFILEMISQKSDEDGVVWPGRDKDEVVFARITDWLDAQQIKYQMTATMGHMCGPTGLYWIDFTGADDPKLLKFSALFENPDGTSLQPEKYMLYQMDYQSWVERGGPEAYEQHLRDLEDPNFEF
jgi:hypothetical protein